MKEYAGLVYLDVQKTGSTQIERYLTRYLSGPPPVGQSHAPLRAGEGAEKLRVISVRDPVASYISLFRYGCDGRGHLFMRLRALGRAGLYRPDASGLNAWLDLVLDPDAAPLLGSGYAQCGAVRLMGLMSYRVVRLFLPRARVRLKHCAGRAEVARKLRRKRFMPDYLIRAERLEEDLLAIFAEEGARIGLTRPVEEIALEMQAERRTNASTAGAALSADDITPDRLARLREAEWVLQDVFGYGAPETRPEVVRGNVVLPRLRPPLPDRATPRETTD
ncbi:MAG: hypothetical protein AAFW69_04205, partial [Pseudomonadota bacterium]